MTRPFAQVDVFGSRPGTGNPVAVVLDATGLSTDEMQAFARWTNLSETTFVLPSDRADYRVRIFTPGGELPFAGHPTLGTCHALGLPGDVVVQECAAGLIELRRTPGGLLAFAAPPPSRTGDVEPATLARVLDACGLRHDQVAGARWCDNGPGWLGLLLRSADELLDLAVPYGLDVPLGLAAITAPGSAHELEVRVFAPENGTVIEDPVTGSFNAAVAQWLLADGLLAEPYLARQGTAMGRDGRVHVSALGGQVWIAGATTTIVTGTVDL